MTTSSNSSRPSVTIVEVKPDEAGQRVDNFLARHLKGVPRGHVYRLLRTGQVRINGGRAKPDRRVEAGDRVRIPPVKTAPRSGNPGQIPAGVVQRLEDSVVYEDAQLLALNKPAGLAVHGGSGLAYGVIEALRQARPNQPFLELVHRLDRDTSGCLLIAKTRQTLGVLHDMLREGEVEKHYLALLAGQWKGGGRRIDAALERGVERGGERMVEVSAEGREASSHFSPLRVFDDASLMDVRIDTGRTHQIRVHAAHVGHPVAGDRKYGDPEVNQRLRASGLKRMFLHALSLEFRLPESGRCYRIEAPLTPELQTVIDRLSESR